MSALVPETQLPIPIGNSDTTADNGDLDRLMKFSIHHQAAPTADRRLRRRRRQCGYQTGYGQIKAERT